MKAVKSEVKKRKAEGRREGMNIQHLLQDIEVITGERVKVICPLKT